MDQAPTEALAGEPGAGWAPKSPSTRPSRRCLAQTGAVVYLERPPAERRAGLALRSLGRHTAHHISRRHASHSLCLPARELPAHPSSSQLFSCFHPKIALHLTPLDHAAAIQTQVSLAHQSHHGRKSKAQSQPSAPRRSWRAHPASPTSTSALALRHRLVSGSRTASPSSQQIHFLLYRSPRHATR